MTYEMICKDCGLNFDYTASMKDGPCKVCPNCNGHAERAYTPIAAHLYGPGTYSHDYKRRVWKKGC